MAWRKGRTERRKAGEKERGTDKAVAARNQSLQADYPTAVASAGAAAAASDGIAGANS